MTKRHRTLALLVGVLGLIPSSSAEAGSPQGYLDMCLRDGRNTLRRLDRDVRSGLSSRDSFMRSCVTGDKVAQIKGLPGYAEVEKLRAQIVEKVTAIEKANADSQAAAKAKALALRPGGSSKEVRERWRVRPKRCTEPDKWAAANQGKAHRRLFSGRSNSGRWPADFSVDDHLARIVCGKQVKGIDPYHRRHDMNSSQQLEGDSRLALAEGVLDGQADEPRVVLYKAALAFECFVSSEWNTNKHRDYVLYAHCREVIGEPPTPEQVKAAAQKLWPDRVYERDNAVYLLEAGLQAMATQEAAFGAIEKEFPRLVEVYRKSARDARTRWEARRKKYAQAYAVLDPITHRLWTDRKRAPDAGCGGQLEGLRAKLAAELGGKGSEAVMTLKVNHPVGYHITEALAFCYLHHGQVARAAAEGRALKEGTRRVSLVEEIVVSRLDARRALEKELKSVGRIRKAIPHYREGSYEVPTPSTWRRSLDFERLAEKSCNLVVVGSSDKEPGQVKKLKKVDGGVELTFKKHTYIRKYREWECSPTGKIIRWEAQATGLTPIYEEKCRQVGPVLKEKITYAPEPIVVSEADGANVKKGWMVLVIDNADERGDAALVHVWKKKKSPEKGSFYFGMPLQ